MGILTVLIQQNAWDDLEAALLDYSSPRIRAELVRSDRLGRTPLHYLCAKKRAPARIVSIMLKYMVASSSRTKSNNNKQNVVLQVDIGGNTVLQAAAMGGNSDVVRVLLEDIPLSITTSSSKEEASSILRLLSRVNDKGMTPLYMAWRKHLDPSFSLFGHRDSTDSRFMFPTSVPSKVATDRLRQIGCVKSMDDLVRLAEYEQLRDLWYKTVLFLRVHSRQMERTPEASISMDVLLRMGGQRIIQCPTIVFWMTLQLVFDSQRHAPTEGNHPLHLAAAYPEFAELPTAACVASSPSSALPVFRDANAPVLTQLAARYPKAARVLNKDRRLALHVAIVNGKEWHRGVYALVRAAPSTMETRDATTRLYPFLLAAASPKASLSLAFELLRARPDLLRPFGVAAEVVTLPRKKPRCTL